MLVPKTALLPHYAVVVPAVSKCHRHEYGPLAPKKQLWCLQGLEEKVEQGTFPRPNLGTAREKKGSVPFLKGGIEAIGVFIGLSKRATSEGLSEAKFAFRDMGEIEFSPSKRILLPAESNSSAGILGSLGVKRNILLNCGREDALHYNITISVKGVRVYHQDVEIAIFLFFF